MRRWAFLLAATLVFGACGVDAESPTTGGPAASATAPGTAPTTSLAAATTTTEAAVASATISTGPKRLGLLPGGRHLDAGVDQVLGRAYDDYVGGIVFSFAGTDRGVWHLEAGRQEPTLLLDGTEVEPFALLDVVDPPSRPPTALVLAGDRLLLLPVTGGAPDALRIVDLAAAGSGSRLRTASLGGDRLLVTWLDADGCVVSDLFDLDGTLRAGTVLHTCEGTDPVLSDEGDIIATVEVGTSTRMVFRAADDGRELARWQITATDGWIHASGGRVAFPTPDGVGLIALDGTTEAIPDPGVLLGVSIARSSPEVSDLASLGGRTALATCSTEGNAPLDVQDGLTEPAARTRDAISVALAGCDLSLLGSLLAAEALVDGDPSLAWWEQEAKGFPALLGVHDVLGLPFATRDEGDRVVFVWPWLATGPDADGPWDDLTSVFNEEDIERWRTGGEPYDRIVIEIDEDGAWISAETGD